VKSRRGVGPESAEPEAPLVSIHLASNRPARLIAFLDNLAETAGSTNAFEVLVNIDAEDNHMAALIADEAQRRTFRLISIGTPKAAGPYSRGSGFSQLFQAADPRAYFLMNLSDEVRFATRNWDLRLASYRGLFADHLFRLRISEHKRRNYENFYSTLPCPENFAIFSRTWLALTQGWGGSWGTDSWHQAVEFCLSRRPQLPFERPRFGRLKDDDHGRIGYFRGIAVNDIVLENTKAGIGETNPLYRARMIRRERLRLASYPLRRTFEKLACRLQAHIEATRIGVFNYLIRENHRTSTLIVADTTTGAECFRLQFDPGRLASFSDNLPLLASTAIQHPISLMHLVKDLQEIRRRWQPMKGAISTHLDERLDRVRTTQEGVAIERVKGDEEDHTASFHTRGM